MMVSEEARKAHAIDSADFGIAQFAEGVDRRATSLLEEVRRDFHVLDSDRTVPPASIGLISHESFSRREGNWADVECVPRPRMARLLLGNSRVASLLHALVVLRKARGRTAIICNGGSQVGRWICTLNHVLGLRRRTILWESFIDTRRLVNERVVRWMIQGSTMVVVYSQSLVRLQAERTRAPENKFVFIPYKANHSTYSPIVMPIGNYIFSGGNSERDYRTLLEAVRGTGIPVIISATDPAITRDLDVPENVIVLAAQEPFFARLMAGSRFVVLPIRPHLVVGAANASACNAMWHGKAVIAAEDSSLADYVLEGESGYVIPSGDVDALRDRILRLWNNPGLAARMGERGQERATDDFTHDRFIRRLNRLGALVAAIDPEATASSSVRGI